MPSALEQLLKGLETENQTSGIIRRLSERRAIRVPRIPTGILALDLASGGGLAVGRMIGIYGAFSSGKSLVAMRFAANAQKHCASCYKESCDCKERRNMRVFWVDAEGCIDGAWFGKNGVNCDELLYLQPEYGEQAIHRVIQVLATREVDVVVIDSLAALVPVKEVQKIEEESEDQDTIGLQARMLNRMFRAVGGRMNLDGADGKWRPTIVVINQTRDVISIGPRSYGPTETRPGGRGQYFATSIDVRLTAAGYVMKESMPVQQRIRFKITKNKTYISQIEGEVLFNLAECTFENVEALTDSALNLGLAGRGNYDLVGIQAGTRSQFTDALKTDPKAQAELTRLIFDRIQR